MNETCICWLEGMGTTPYCPECYASELAELAQEAKPVIKFRQGVRRTDYWND